MMSSLNTDPSAPEMNQNSLPGDDLEHERIGASHRLTNRLYGGVPRITTDIDGKAT
jgi:hypothetical protein